MGVRPKVFCDFHHSSLLRSLVLLFEGRLGTDVYRPIGMEWFDEGYWAINNLRDTAEQFLKVDSQPVDRTPPLNWAEPMVDGVYWVADPGAQTHHRACTLDFFKQQRFDYIIASIPAHVPIFEALRQKYQPQAKLIVQMGNNWDIDQYAGYNVLASIAPTLAPGVNAHFYHQEFDLRVFNDTPVQPVRRVYSFLNVIEKSGIGWNDYSELKRQLERQGWEFRAYGGQCPDGGISGAEQVAKRMREAAFIFHVKPGGDGFGHVIHNAYAVGRPVITRPSHYRGQLAERLLVPGTFIDLDRYGRPGVKNILTRLMHDPEGLEAMGRRAAERFDEVVNFEREAEEIRAWLIAL
jgi:hypothetical protein